MEVTFTPPLFVRALEIVWYIVCGLFILYIAADLVNEDIIAMFGLVFFFKTVQLKHLLFDILFLSGSVLWARMMPVIVERK